MAPRLRALAVLAIVAVCCNDGGCVQPPVQQPPPAQRPTFPDDAGYERDDAGRPILGSFPSPIAPGFDLQLVYDEKLDDPIARWGFCLDRVVACANANRGRSLDGCFKQIERCGDESGGFGCCPPACIDAYAARRTAGDSTEAALKASLFAPTCVAGVEAQLAAARGDGGAQP